MLKRKNKKGFISIEYVIIASLVMLITAVNAPRLFEGGKTLVSNKISGVNDLVYQANTTTNNIFITGGGTTTNTIPVEPDKPVLPEEPEGGGGNGGGDIDESIVHPEKISLRVPTQSSGGPIEETTNKITLDLKPGDQISVQAKIIPVNATNKAIKWINYNADIAQANQNGLIVAKTPGTALIRVEAVDNGVFNEITVNVKHINANDITVSPDNLVMTVGDVEELKVNFNPQNTTYRKCTFTGNNNSLIQVDPIDNERASVSAVGANKTNNKTSVTVSCEVLNDNGSTSNIVKEVKVEVLGRMVPTESIEIKELDVKLEVGQTHQINAVVKPDNATIRDLAYESMNIGVAQVTNTGLVTANNVGQTYIYVKNYGGDFYGKEIINAVKITVVPKRIPLTKLDIKYPSNTLPVGQTMSPTITYTPNNTTETELKWRSSNDGIAKVSSLGQVEGLREGVVTIIATSISNPQITSSFQITITPRINNVTGITLSPKQITLKVGDSADISAKITPDNAANKYIHWTTSDPLVATVGNGRVLGIGKGECVITARTDDGGYTDTVKVTVNEILSDSITLNIKDQIMHIGDTVQLVATVMPDNVTDKNVFWSYVEKTTGKPVEGIITLDNNGQVTAYNYGEVIVTATTGDGRHKATCTIKVVPIDATEIIMPKEITLLKGEKYKISAQVMPESVDNKTLSWKSDNNNLVTVSQDGTVTADAKRYGETYVTATWTNGVKTISAKTKVIVKPTLPSILVFTPNEHVVRRNNTVQGEVKILPADNDFTDVRIESSDPSIFTISNIQKQADGITYKFNVNGIKIGDAEIIATATKNNITERAIVHVITDEIFAESMTVNPENITIEIGQSITPTVTITPTNTTNKQLTWESEDPLIATVDSKTGKITGVSVGRTFINVKLPSSGLWVRIMVDVDGIFPKKLIANPSSINTVKFAAPTPLTITIEPASATNKELSYKILDANKKEITDPDKYPLWVSMPDPANPTKYTVDPAAAGVYYLRFFSVYDNNVFVDVPVSIKTGPWDGMIQAPIEMEIKNRTCYPKDGWHLAWIAWQNDQGTLANHCTSVIQAADIDLNNHKWTPMGDTTHPFAAVYNGSKYKITNLNVSGEDIVKEQGLKETNKEITHYGLFGYNMNPINNVIIENAKISYTGLNNPNHKKVYIGTLGGHVSSINYGVVKKTNISVNPSANEETITGTVAGRLGV